MNEQQNHLSQLLEQKTQITSNLKKLENESTRLRDLMLKTQGAIEYLEATGVKLSVPEVTEEVAEEVAEEPPVKKASKKG